jgi:hypothetical protein
MEQTLTTTGDTNMKQLTDLQTSVIEQLGFDNGEELLETFKAVNEHGAGAGFNGFIYHLDTVQFASNNKALIMAELRDAAEDSGMTIAQYVAGFRCLSYVNALDVEMFFAGLNEDDTTAINNALAWFALELVSAQLEDSPELYTSYDIAGLG